MYGFLFYDCNLNRLRDTGDYWFENSNSKPHQPYLMPPLKRNSVRILAKFWYTQKLKRHVDAMHGQTHFNNR